MAEQNWENLGEQVKDRVDQAVRYGDFTNLSRSIGDMINNTIDGVKDSLHAGGRYTSYSGNDSQTRGTQGQYGAQDGNGARRGYGAQGQYGAQSGNAARGQYAENRGARAVNNAPVLYQKVPTGKVSGILMCAGGYSGTVIFGIFLLIFLILGAIDGAAYTAVMIVFGVLTGASVVLAAAGTRRLGLANRFSRFARLIKQQMYVPVQTLADKTGRSVEKTMADLKRMIAKRMFLQAHLDEDGRCLILTDSAYQEYLTAKTSYNARRREEEARQQERDRLSPEHRALVETGESYIRHIHDCNEKLSGEEISAKLDTMERVVTRIFAVVQAHPETAGELGKLMDYYLPTTKKLLDVYLEMDAQPVEGTNISATKREIEDTIDTLNAAFEKLFDDLFEDKAWDISTDISVLNTVLAQDGLKDDGLKQKK